jgi:hypothetical protein
MKMTGVAVSSLAPLALQFASVVATASGYDVVLRGRDF